jgi:hypothetical protein
MALDWAGKRRLFIIGGFALAGVVLLAILAFALFYRAPSCTDGKHNGSETGIDCGGSCELLCRADVLAPNVSNPPAFARAVSYAGRTDVVAYVENRNRNAEAKDAPYVIELFDAEGRRLGSREGIMDIPARSVVPVFAPGVIQGVGTAVRAFVSFEDDVRWRTPRGAEDLLTLGVPQIVTGVNPRVRVPVENRSASAMPDRTLVAVIYGAGGSIVAASQTVVRALPAYGTAEAVFTWYEPFPEGALRAEVRAVPVLP